MFLCTILFLGKRRYEFMYEVDDREFSSRANGDTICTRAKKPKAWRHGRGASAIAHNSTLARMMAEAAL